MKCRNIIFSQHAFTRMFEREISPEVAKRATQMGEVIEDYPDHIVTAYWPDPKLWCADFKVRRKK